MTDQPVIIEPTPEHVPTFRVVAVTWPGARRVRDVELDDPLKTLTTARKLFRRSLFVVVYESTATGQWARAYDLEPSELRGYEIPQPGS